MTEGRELDAQIAEKVMGWRVHHRNTAHYVLPGMRDYKVEASVNDWHPSTDIAAAWQVVEAMQKKGWSFRCGCGECRSQNVAAFFRLALGRNILTDGYIDADYIAVADTMSRAICLAALNAMERA